MVIRRQRLLVVRSIICNFKDIFLSCASHFFILHKKTDRIQSKYTSSLKYCVILRNKNVACLEGQSVWIWKSNSPFYTRDKNQDTEVKSHCIFVSFSKMINNEKMQKYYHLHTFWARAEIILPLVGITH